MDRKWNLRRATIVVAALVSLVAATPGQALFLDEAKNFKLTGVFYSQARLRLQNSSPVHGPQTNPFFQGGNVLSTGIGNLSQWRNFAQPAFEGNPTSVLGLEDWLDELSFRFVGRFVYDGVYDFGPAEFAEALQGFRAAAAAPAKDGSVGLGGNQPVSIFQGEEKVEQDGDDAQRARRLADQELFDPRDVFAQQADPWEIYVNVQKGPVWFRIGRQALSWGETDGLRLLDVINPIDNFFGLTFDEDLDEKRVPLWMLRSVVQLADHIGPVSNLAIEGFGVPGIIDTRQAPIPFQSFLHPYAPPTGCDAQLITDNTVAAQTGLAEVPPRCRNALEPDSPFRGLVKTSLYERLPKKKWNNSRYGARLTGVLLRDYTFSLAAYRTWADNPNGLAHFLDVQTIPGPNINIPTTVVIELTHGTETIVGGTLSFFQPRVLPGVVRMEAGYFMGEPTCTRITCQGNPTTGLLETFVPDADFIRWSFGYDVFEINVPWLSQTSNIIVIAQMFNSYRLTDHSGFVQLALDNDLPEDLGKFAYIGNPARNGREILNGVADRYSAVWSLATQTFLMHGNLIPQIIGVALTEGDFGFLPSLTYRFSDTLLVKVGYAGIYGKFSSLGLFRDRDQLGVRVSYLLN